MTDLLRILAGVGLAWFAVLFLFVWAVWRAS